MAKLAKRLVNYRRGRGAFRHCGNCSMFKPRLGGSVGTCTLVAGDIRAADVCDRWAAR